jgi:hypothetical protein
MTMEDFKANGISIFGKDRFEGMSIEIQSRAASITDQMIIVGWGHAEAAVMLYQVDAAGASSHKLTGSVAIGSGGYVAASNLLLLGQSRDTTLSQTIYNVAAAKFAAEHSVGRYVGQNTSIHVSWKRPSGDDRTDNIVGEWVMADDVEKLRAIWEQHGRPRVPDAGVVLASQIAGKLTGTTTVREMSDTINAAARLAKPQD